VYVSRCVVYRKNRTEGGFWAYGETDVKNGGLDTLKPDRKGTS
jgi:hypothetical protein